MKLTDHFSLEEFQRSSTATAQGINNTIPEAYIPKLKALCEHVLEPLRAHANQPIVIGSGYRCPTLNKAVGGVSNSQHQLGEACDISAPTHDANGNKLSPSLSQSLLKEWFLWIMDNLQFDCLIWEKNTPSNTHHWIHVSYREGNCRQRVVRNLIKYPSK